MHRFTVCLSTLLMCLIIILGCSSGGGSPVAPHANNDPAGSNMGQLSGGDSNHILWGMWDCRIDPISGQVEIVPLRTANFTANVNNLLEAQPGNLLIENIDAADYLTEGRIDCTVKLKHPFPGLDMYNGFDVWGVFMHNGSTSLGYDGLVYSDGSNDDEAVLLNPDGWTRWFNYTEFFGTTIPILEYYPGKLSDLPNPSATLNPFKIFADGLDAEDDYYTWVTTSGNADDRGVFKAGFVNSRRYELKFPMVGGSPALHFQYAVIATWEPADPTLTGDPDVYDIDDFPSSANCEEAFFVNIDTDESDLYYEDSSTFGGNLIADIEVFDWQGGSVGGLGVLNEVNSIIVKADFIPSGSQTFSQAQLAAIATSGTVNSSVFQVEIANCTPSASGEADMWVIVEADGLNADSYGQDFPTEYPDPARRAAFQLGSVTVSDEYILPSDVIYVDDSNTSGVEDGTPEHPYNTIQEGIDAAALLVDYEVWVDDSGSGYEENVYMESDTILRSRNWDGTDGTNRAYIDAPEIDNTHTVYFTDVDNSIIDGFQIGYAGLHNIPSGDILYQGVIIITGGSNNMVQDCLFSGSVDEDPPVIAVTGVSVFDGATDVTVAHCRFEDIHPFAIYYYGVVADGVDGMTVRNCVMTNLLYEDGPPMLWHDHCMGFEIRSSSNVVVKNNLIHHLISDPDFNVEDFMVWGFEFAHACTGIEVSNNTIDYVDMTEAYNIQQFNGYTFVDSIDLNFTNNLATNIFTSIASYVHARGVTCPASTLVTVYYTDFWNLLTPLYNATPGTGYIEADPLYIDADNAQYDLTTGSPAQMGDPSFVDWDDTGAPSGDPGNTDPNTRSRMGCHGGPGGEIVGLLTPE